MRIVINANLEIGFLAIGTELTTGQINNGNARWIAQKFQAMGIPTSLQICVPDERKLITDALDFLATRCDLILTSGGLGPTSDDFTREVIATWAGVQLTFSEAALTEISAKLASRGIPLRDGHRKECYFPQGAIALSNRFGTAPAFILEQSKVSTTSNWRKLKAREVVVLPGPPKEIAGIWEDHLEPRYQLWAKSHDGVVTLSWDTIGRPESEIAETVVACLAKLAPLPSGAELGYRVHLPYIEVKVSLRQSQVQSFSHHIDALDQALAENLVNKNGRDSISDFIEALKLETQVWIMDEATQGALWSRLSAGAKPLLLENRVQILSGLPARDFLDSLETGNGESYAAQDLHHQNRNRLILSIREVSELEAEVRVFFQNLKLEQTLQVSGPISKSTERRALYWTEMALLHWTTLISKLRNT